MRASSDYNQQSVSLDDSSNFSLAVASDTSYQLNATLTMDGMQDVEYNAQIIKYAAFDLPEGVMVDLAQDDVSITIDGKIYEFPASRFEWKGDARHYAYKTEPGIKPRIQASIDLGKSKWSLKLIHISSEFVDNSDGVDIALSIGDYQGSENVYLESKYKHDNMLMYKRKPKIRCGQNDMDDDDDASDDKHPKEHDHKDKDKDDDEHQHKGKKDRDKKP